MKYFLVPLLWFALVYSTAALTTDEESALEALFHSFPSLASEYPGWSTNTSLACEAPVFYGLQCSDGPDPHVLSMYAAPSKFNFSRMVNFGRLSSSCSSAY
jgi:hypothetical protein